MSGLALNLLGTPEVTQDGRLVTGFRSVKARALLFYIAVSDQPESRAKLAGFLWGDLPEKNANANLRKTLTNLRKLVGSHLVITRETVAVDRANPPWVDVCEFELAVDSSNPVRLETAVSLYHGDFLEGFYVEGVPEFETWLLAERHRLHEKLLLALHSLAKHYAALRRYTPAIRHAQHLLDLEPLHENVHRLLMTLFTQSGQTARALAQYELCAEVLAEELATEPGPETTVLFSRIREGQLGPAVTVQHGLPRHNLPAATTSFVGRETELEQIKTWLGELNRRLLTIVGPGGVGKTRLAMHAAWAALGNFTHGVWRISLTALTDGSNVPAAVAATLGINLSGLTSPEIELANYLRHQELLLVFDNAEHLVSQPFADFLVEILSKAASVKIIVTSRERLVMQAEQVLDLPGLAYPEAATDIADRPYPAAQLFTERTLNHGISLAAAPEVDTAVHRLCRLVDGLPLALELAATWPATMSLSAINAELERGIAFLTTNMRDVPPRHRSIQAVFDTSWQLLEEEERRHMRQLAYFRGGFSTQAVAGVVGASPRQLGILINKSLIRQEDDGRYDIHELVRQYAVEKLAKHPAEEEDVAHRHGRYFADFLATREEAIQGSRYLQARTEIEAEIDNVRKAWEWSVAARNLENIARSIETLHYYFLNTQGLFSEAAQRFHQAATQIAGYAAGNKKPLVGRLLLRAATNQRMLGQLEEASSLVEESLSIFYQHELAADIIRATSLLAVIRLQQNEKEKALHLAITATDQARELDAPIDLCLCLNNLAYALAHNGKYKEAVATAEESVALAQAIDYPHGELSAMNMLGVYSKWTGDIDRAKRIFEELVVRYRTTATQSRLAQAVNNLGLLYKDHGEPGRAMHLLQEAKSLYEAVGQVHYAALVKSVLGKIAVEQGNLELAQCHCLQALQTARELEYPALAVGALDLYGRLAHAQDEDALAVSILVFTANHPAALVETKAEIDKTLQILKDTMSPQTFASAREKGLAWTLEEVINEVLVSYNGPCPY